MNFFVVLVAVLPSLTWAHGPIASQASTAVTRATALFLTETGKNQDEFQSVSSTLIGEERFKVEFTLKDGVLLSYTCGLDESVKPVKWGCKKDMQKL